MTKAIFILFLICTLSSNPVNALIPIPTRNSSISFRANLQKLQMTDTYNSENAMGKRVLHVNIKQANSSLAPCGTIWVISLDGLDVLGPYEVCDGTPLIVEIDDREWDVLVDSEDTIEVEVWIE